MHDAVSPVNFRRVYLPRFLFPPGGVLEKLSHNRTETPQSPTYLHLSSLRHEIPHAAGKMAGLQNPQQRPSRAPSELHHAAYTGSVKGITAALSRRLTPVDQPGRHGRTALMGAAYKGYSRVMEILLEKGASVKMGDDEGVAALHVAAGEGHVDATKVLVKAGADVEAATLRGDTALHWASDNGHAGVIRALIEAGADPDKRRVDDGSTALYMACRQGFLDAVMELLRSKANPLIVQRMDPSRVQAKDCTPLDAAAANGHSEVVRAMMSVVGIEGYGGACRCVRALGLAAFGNHLTVVRILTDAGVKDTGEALINASMNGRGISVKFLLQQEDGRTRSGGALVNTARDMNGNTPLVLAIVCSESSPGVARLLVDAGADTTSVVRTGTAGRLEGFSGTPMDLVMHASAI